MNFNTSIPLTKVFIKASNLSEEQGFFEGYWYGVTSIPGNVLMCSVMLENGANWNRLPIHWLKTSTASETDLEPKFAQLYDCFSYEIQCIEYQFLAGQRVKLLDLGVLGNYLFTIDSVDKGKGGFAQFPGQEKNHHIIELDTGVIVVRPNNYLQFVDKALYKVQKEMPQFKRLEQHFSCEKK